MMSVKELFYGNQPVTSWMMSTPVPQAKQYSPAPGYPGNYQAYSHDRDGLHTSGYNYYNPSLDAFMPRFYGQDSLHPITNSFSGYTPSARQFETSSWDSSYDRSQLYNRDYSSSNHGHNNRRHGGDSAALQVVELRVPLCCEACEERVIGHLRELRGVEAVRCDHYNNKVVVRGRTSPAELLGVCIKLFKGSEFWSSY